MACLEEKTLLSKKNMATKLHLNQPQDFWNIVLWTEETKVGMFGHNVKTKHRISTQIPHTNCQPRGAGVFVLQPRDLGTLRSLSRP